MHSSVQPAIARPSWTPLAVTVLLHLLLVLAWRWQATAPAPASLPERWVELVTVRPPAAPAPAAAIPLPRPARTPRQAPAPAAPSTRAPAPIETVVAEEAAAADTPQAPAEPAPPMTLGAEDLLAAGKRRAAAFDREQRKGKSGVPEEAGTPWARFREGVAAAYIDRSTATLLEKYESPDGVIVYRTTQGGKRTCRMTGAVVFGPGAAGGGSAAGNVACPKNVSWEPM